MPDRKSNRKSEQVFSHRLEALRGVAALMVACMHSTFFFDAHGWQSDALAFSTVLLNGRVAVTLFFVLSGLVLGLSLERSREPFATRTALFYLRRVFRIGAAHWVAIGLIVGMMITFHIHFQHPEGTTEFAGLWSQPITAGQVIKNCLFLDNSLNMPAWTLKTEMICSVSLPFMIWFSARGSWGPRTVLLGLLMLLTLFHDGNARRNVFLFYLGSLLPEAGVRFKRWLPTTKRAGAIMLLLASAVFLSNNFWAARWAWCGTILIGMGAGVVVNCVYQESNSPWFRFLDWPIVRFYGRISYSFYLYHLFCLFLVASAVMLAFPSRALPEYPLLFACIVCPISIAAATLPGWLSCRFVEKPAIDLSKHLCKRLGSSRGANLPQNPP